MFPLRVRVHVFIVRLTNLIALNVKQGNACRRSETAGVLLDYLGTRSNEKRSRGGRETMQISVGKHRGTPIEILVLKEPDYVTWMLNSVSASGGLMTARAEAARLVRFFDAKAFVEDCNVPDCTNLSTRLSAYRGSVQTVPWCESCNLYSLGASAGKLSVVRTYRDAVDHVMISSGRRADLQAVIKSLARAKGLPARVGHAQAEAFFSE